MILCHHLLLIILPFFLTGAVNDHNFSNSRKKRTLTYLPPGGVVQMVMGVGLPIFLDPESIIVGFVLKGGYGLPTNSSDYTRPTVNYARKSRSLSRWKVYQAISQISQVQGLGGKECVLRTICELSQIPVDQKLGILEELVHTIFTPSTTNEPVESRFDNIYHAAERIGRTKETSCEAFFPECRNSYSKIFTRLQK